MATRAHHLALLDFVEDALPAALRELGADRERLVAEVVELEDDGIGLPAVATRVDAEILDKPTGSLEHQPLLLLSRLRDVALPVRRVMLLAVCGPAGTTKEVPLPSCSPPP